MKSRHNKYDSRKPDHFRYKPAKAAHGKSIGGAARFVQQLAKQGLPKPTVRKAVLERWPKFHRDMVGFESRWRHAKKLVHHQHKAQHQHSGN